MRGNGLSHLCRNAISTPFLRNKIAVQDASTIIARTPPKHNQQQNQFIYVIERI